MSDETPVGQRFSQVYLQHGSALRDGPRFRKRLRVNFDRAVDEIDLDFASEIERATGCDVPGAGYGPDWDHFFDAAEVRDVLDGVTIIARCLAANEQTWALREWVTAVSQVFREENMGYRLDGQAGVHFLVDEEFERSRVAALAGLGAARYRSSRTDFEFAYAALDRDPIDTRSAVRHVFDALETVFKLALDNSVSRLGAAEIDKKFGPLVLPLYDGAARDNAGRMLASFREWTNGAHQYRHAQGTEQPSPPPLDLAVTIVSSGSAWLRWLIEIDGRLHGTTPSV